MKTQVHLFNCTTGRSKLFTVKGRPSDVSDKVVRIKRALKINISHGVQAL